MPRSPLTDPSEASDEPLSSESFHELPPELDDEEFDAVDVPTGDEPLRSARVPRRKLLLAGAVVAVLTLLAGGLLGYRTHHRRAVLQEGLARADTLLRLDTAAGYRGAAALLEPLAQLDPLDAAGARAFALAMLATDYRDASAGRTAELLLVEPMRADEVPPRASLAAAALALGRREAGDAMTAAVRAGALPEARVISGRIANARPPRSSNEKSCSTISCPLLIWYMLRCSKIGPSYSSKPLRSEAFLQPSMIQLCRAISGG